MPFKLSCIAENDTNADSEPPTRPVGTHITTESWWWDRYDEIAEHLYDLHPRCHPGPKWQPTCLKYFYAAEDIQVNIVRPTAITSSPRLIIAMVEGSNERYRNAR
jgi:hypothetical protein